MWRPTNSSLKSSKENRKNQLRENGITLSGTMEKMERYLSLKIMRDAIREVLQDQI